MLSTNRPLTLALAAIFAMLVLVNGISAPFQKDAEPQSAEWIQSIVRDGHWLIPHDDYGAVDRKPPLFYWLSATIAKLSGNRVDETRARLVSLIAGIALATLVLAWTAANVGIVEGWLAFLLMLATYGFASRATTALTDMMLTLLMLAAYSAMFPLLDGRVTARRVVAVGILLGLGVLTKGPVAIVLCALAALIFLLIERRSPLPIARERWPFIVLAIALAIGAAWYLPVMIFGKEKILKIIFAENFGHFMPAKLGGTGESYRPFYFIGARLLGGAFPMTLLVAPAIAAFYTGEIEPQKRRAVIYQTSMPLAVLVFFTIASVKRDDYILPAIPGIAILCASVFSLAGPRGIAARIRDVVVLVFTVGCAAAIFIGFAFARTRPDFPLGMNLQSSDALFAAIFGQGLATVQTPFVIFAIALSAAAVIAAWSYKRRFTLGLGFSIAMTGIAGTLFWTAVMRPEVAAMRSLMSFAPQIAATAKGAAVCVPNDLNYELSFYYGAAIPSVASGRCPSPTPATPVYLVATPRELDAMTPQNRARLKLVVKSELIGGGGPPALYQMMPAE
jgi:4-amino-4-deoxy-L-arabinose transferase-like glycosyltransferase